MNTYLVITKARTDSMKALVATSGRAFILDEIKSNSPSGEPGLCVTSLENPGMTGIWIPEKMSRKYQYKICGLRYRPIPVEV